MNDLMARIFTKAMSGDVAALKALMDYGGFHPDQKLKDKERAARIKALEDGDLPPVGGDLPDDEEGEDVVIYLPENGRDDDA